MEGSEREKWIERSRLSLFAFTCSVRSRPVPGEDAQLLGPKVRIRVLIGGCRLITYLTHSPPCLADGEARKLGASAVLRVKASAMSSMTQIEQASRDTSQASNAKDAGQIYTVELIAPSKGLISLPTMDRRIDGFAGS